MPSITSAEKSALNTAIMGCVAYPEALELQKRLQALRIRQEIDDTLLLLSHPPVLTLGTRGKREQIFRSDEQLARDKVTVHRINRGGSVTYHGPGQVVGYPILDVARFPGKIRSFVAAIEQAIIDMLAEQFGLASEARTGKMTGVWVDNAKICAIGIGVKQGVTLHGFALNVNTDLSCFDWINPCGLSLPVTSIAEETQKTVDFDQVMEWTARYMVRAFSMREQRVTPEKIWQWAEEETDL